MINQNSSWAFNVDQQHTWAYWDDAFTKEECEKIIQIGKEKSLKKAEIDLGDLNQVRDSNIAWLYAADDMEWAFRKLTDIITNLNNQFFNFQLFGMIEGLQFTEYNAPSGFYGLHMDKSFGRSIRKLSITVQLSDPSDYENGELSFKTGTDSVLMEKTQGKLIAFPSYLLHEVKPVSKGTRYSLVAWVTGDPFK